MCPSLAGVPVVIFCFHQCKRFNFYERLNRFLIHLSMHFSVLLLVYKTKSNIFFSAANNIPLVLSDGWPQQLLSTAAAAARTAPAVIATAATRTAPAAPPSITWLRRRRKPTLWSRRSSSKSGMERTGIRSHFRQEMRERLTDWLVDWRISWLIGGLAGWRIVCLKRIGWLMTDWLMTDWLIDWLIGWPNWMFN